MTILVTVPYFGCPDLIDRCVASILGQTERDIAVLVIGDGEVPPITLRDDRLEVVTLPENNGPYFCQQVAITASPFPWYAVVGADDYLEPDHLERLLALTPRSDAVATGTVWFHDLAGNVKVHEAPTNGYEVGLFGTDRLRSVGGHNPTERVGQDTLLLHVLTLTGPVVRTTHPTYHRIKREGSLMTSPWTGKGTPYRNDVKRRNRIVLRRCTELASSLPALRTFREQLIPLHVRNEVAEHAARVAARLGQAVAA